MPRSGGIRLSEPKTLAELGGELPADGSLTPADLYLSVGSAPDALTKALALTMKAMAAWSYAEHDMATLTNTFVSGNLRVVNAILQSSDGRGYRLRALKAAAEEEIRPEADRNLLKRTLTELEKAKTRRDEYAHHIWAHSEAIPDGLMLIDPKYLASVETDAETTARTVFTARVGQVIQYGFSAPRGPDPAVAFGLDRSRVRVFTLEDIQTDFDAMQEARHLLLLLLHVLRGLPTADRARTELESRLPRRVRVRR